METITSRRALLIDDDSMVRAMLTDALEIFGYIVDAVESGKEALTRFAVSRYDVVITDLLMPEMSGLDLVEELRRIEPAVRVILLTGTGGSSTAEDARGDGVLTIHKPVGLTKLKDALETWCHRPVGA